MAKQRAAGAPIIQPNLGLYLDRPSIAVPPGALQDGLNFRLQQGNINNLNLGWSSFMTPVLNGAVMGIFSLTLRNGTTQLIFATPTDLYLYSTSGGGSVTYLTPTYTTGTASASGTAVTGSGTAWNSATNGFPNVRVGDQISFGSASVNSTSATWFTIQTINSDTSLTLHTSAGTVGSGAYTIRHLFQGSTGNPWTYDVFVNAQPNSDDRIYMTNGIDPLVEWNGTQPTANLLTTVPFSVCKTLLVYKNSLVVANVVQSGTIKPTDLLNSDVSSPESFSTGLAGQFKISGTTDQIVRLAALGDYMIIYLQKNVLIASFVGSPLIYTFRVAVAKKGLQAVRGIAIYPAYHEFMGADAMYSFDGSFAREGSVHVWREIIRTQDPARQSMVQTLQDEQRGDYMWAVGLTTDPGAGSIGSPPAVAWTEHYLEPRGPMQPYLPKSDLPYSKRSFPFTASGSYLRANTLTWNQITTQWNQQNYKWNDQFFAAGFPQILVGDANGAVWILNGAQDANGVALNSFVTFGRRPVGDGKMRALITRIYPFVTQFPTPINVTVSLADFAMGPATISQTNSFDQSFATQGLYFSPIYRVGRYVDIQFGTTGPAQPYVLSGYDMEVKPGGLR